ncbi:hypothetical protein CHUAL_003623 [Chamberlinius hualienensis]
MSTTYGSRIDISDLQYLTIATLNTIAFWEDCAPWLQLVLTKVGVDPSQAGKRPKFRSAENLQHYHRSAMQIIRSKSVRKFDAFEDVVLVSKAPLVALKIVQLKALKVEKQNLNRCVILRILADGMTDDGLITVVEDTKGTSCALLAYNYTSYDVFEIGTVLVIKEPYFRMAMKRFPYIKCDSSTDIIMAKNYNSISSLTDRIVWKNDLSRIYESPVQQYPVPASAEEWNARGELFCIKSLWNYCLEACEFGIQKTESQKTDIWRKLKINIATAYLAMEYNEKAVIEAKEILQHFPQDEDALRIAGICYFRFRQYYEACQTLEKCKDKSALTDLYLAVYCGNDELGAIDVKWLRDFSLYYPNIGIECGEYCHPALCRVEIPHKGNGMWSTTDIERGTLLISSKALAHVFKSKGNSMNYDKLRNDLISTLMQLIIRNPRTFEYFLSQLTAGDDYPNSTDGLFTREYSDEIIGDIELVKAICTHNEIILGYYDDPPSDDCWAKFGRGLGLFLTPSFLNHSCIPNVYTRFCNDVVLIFAGRTISKNEEILMSYALPNTPYEERSEYFRRRGFVCHCMYCGRKELNPKMF